MEEKFKKLAQLGAGEFVHLNSSLIEHLKATKDLLKDWGASDVLQDAGLYHAAYGTAGFEQSLVSPNQRMEITSIIGKDAEEIIYQYCACDRQDFFGKIVEEAPLLFLNRFTEESYFLSEKVLKNFCELTVANELELAMNNTAFADEHGDGLYQLFSKMKPYLSDEALRQTKLILLAPNRTSASL